ncbi:MAG: FtsX-like permease family protein, partial [bacterium]|nr:FtsX-like permease family protein [bacterium]
KVNWDDPIGKDVSIWGARNGKVIGVLKDFNYHSLHLTIKPLIVVLNPDDYNYVSLRIKPDNIPSTIEYIEEIYEKFSLEYPFEYFFLDEIFNSVYRSEQKLSLMFGYFSFLAILIACLGLFGLTTSTAESRIKEIGIRKTLGATVKSIILLLSREFMKFIIIANIIAFPVAYFAVNSWLENFAFRINIGIWLFVFSGILSIMIALITVSYRVLIAANSNPVDSLRYE